MKSLIFTTHFFSNALTVVTMNSQSISFPASIEVIYMFGQPSALTIWDSDACFV